MNIRVRWLAALASTCLMTASVLAISATPVMAIPVAPCGAGTFSANGLQPCSAIPDAFTTAGCWTLTVPSGATDVDVDAIGAAGAAGSNPGGRGDEMAGRALGFTDGAQLTVCVDRGGGTGGPGALNGANGGGASGVSAGSDFSHPFVVAGAGGGGAAYYGGDAGLPNAQDGVNGGGGGSNTNSTGGAGGQALYPGVNKGSDGAGFDANGPGHGGGGGAGDTADAGGGGAGGGGGYFGGGGGGNGDWHSGGGTGGGGGTSFCGGANVSVTVSDCTRTGGAGTGTVAGSGAGQAKVALTFHSPVTCAPGKYSANGLDSPVACQPIPAAFTAAGCWTLTVPTDKTTVNADVIGAAGGIGYESHGGRGDEVAATAAGLANSDQLRVCVDQGGGDIGNFYFQGGGASGVSFGTDFSHPFIVAGGGGASGAAIGGDAGMPTGQTGAGSGPGTGGDNASHQGGTGGSSSASSIGGDGQAFTAAGPGAGGPGGGPTCCGTYPGGSGGAGYYGGGGAGGGGDGTGGSTPPGGGGGGSSYCGADNVSLSVAGCVRTGGVGTSADAGAGGGQAKVILTFASGTQCGLGSYSSTGTDTPNACTPADAGHYVDTVGASSQSQCALGYYQPSTGQSSCLAAGIGYYVDTTAASSETKCPDGTTTAGTGSTSSTECESTSSPYQPDAMVRLSGFPRIGQNIYSPDGTGETLTLKPLRYHIGAARIFYVYFQNDGSVADTFTIGAVGTGVPGYVVTYKLYSGPDITAAVQAGTYTTPVVQPGHTFAIRAKVKIVAGVGHGTQVERVIEATSVGDSGQVDAIGFVLARK